MSQIRYPAVAGLFYPADAHQLDQDLDQYLSEAKATDIPPPKALILPHAGYIYSAVVAASGYRLLRSTWAENIKRVILLGPSHRVGFHGIATSSAEVFLTPLGSIEVDQGAYDLIRHFPQVIEMDAAHLQEHSLEVHLPFLQHCLHDFLLVPLVVGEISAEEMAEVLEALWGDNSTLIVVSSDLSHYHDYLTAQRIDHATSEAIKNGKYEQIGGNEACGFHPLNGLLLLAKRRGLAICQLDQRNSADTAGSKDQVVGYGAYAVGASC